MAIDPKLLVIKPVDELAEVTGLQAGSMLFYDGSDNLKRISIDTFNNLSKTAKPLKPTDATPTEEGLYMPTESGTYANADGLIAQDGYYTLFFFNGTNWIKSESKYPEASNNIRLWEDLQSNDFPLTESFQVIYEDKIFIVKDGETASSTDTPNEDSLIWQAIGGSKKAIENIENATRFFLSGAPTEDVDYNSLTAVRGTLKADGTVVDPGTDGYNKVLIIDLTNAIHVKITAKPFYSTQVNDYSMFVGVRADNSVVSLLPPQQTDLLVTFDVDVSGFVSGKVCYNYLSNESQFLVTVTKTYTDAVKKYVDKSTVPFDTVLKSFVHPTNYVGRVDIQTSGAVPGSLQNNNTNSDPGSVRGKVLMNVNTNGKAGVSVTMKRNGENGGNTEVYPSILGVRADNTTIVLLPNSFLSDNEGRKTWDIEIPAGITNLSFCYSISDIFVPFFYDSKNSDPKEDAVLNAILEKSGDNFNPYQKTSLRYFARPTSIARLEVMGTLPTDIAGTKVKVSAKLYSNNTLLLNCSGKMSLQGSSSLHMYVKKNFTFDLIDDAEKAIDVKIGQWEAFDSFHLKAYATDITMSRDVGSGMLWNKIRTNRPYPSNVISSPLVTGTSDTAKSNSYDGAMFFTDGFPFEMWVNGAYHGLFVWRIKKDVKNYRLDNALKTHFFLANSNVDELKWNTFDHTQWELKSPKVAGYQENGAITDPVVLEKLTRLWTWFEQVRTGAVDFEATASQYINLDSFVDYIIASQMVHHWDNWANNMILTSWDGNVWSLVPYDMDFSIGRVSPFMPFNGNPAQLVWRGSFWSGTIYPKLLARIKIRWQALRASGFVTPKLYQDCYKPFFTTIGRNLYQAEAAKWEFVEENTGKDNLNYFLKFGSDKITYLDSIWNQ